MYRINRFLAFAILVSFAMVAKAQNPINWTTRQLMEPAELATEIKANGALPVIISVGPGAVIPNSVAVGMTGDQEGLDKLKATLATLPKTQKIVVYCGCCPFEHCPNVRPAISALQEMNFINYYLLNIPNNIKKDWIEYGYPVVNTPK